MEIPAGTRRLCLSAASELAIVLLCHARLVGATNPSVGVAGGAVTAVGGANRPVCARARAIFVGFQGDAGAPSGYARAGSSNPLADLVQGVAVQNGRAFVAAGAAGLWVFDVSQAGDPPAIGSLTTPGYAEGVACTGTLALVADGPLGLRVVDVSNPAQPSELGAVFEGQQIGR